MNAPAPPDPFRERLARPRPVLLDGGLATQLEAMGQALHPTLWSAGLLATHPDALQAAHEAYLDAGAEVLISASYQASREGFATIGRTGAEADELLRRSVRIARRAIHARGARRALVAASSGPWGAIRHDGSEYSGDYAIDEAGLEAFHQERLAVLDTAGADVLACETIPNGDEVAVIGRLLRHTRTPAWVSFCCADGALLRDGTPVEAAAARFRDHPGVAALGVNCTAPRHVVELIGRLRRAAPDLPVLVYPNSGEAYDATSQSWSGLIEPLDAGRAALSWIGAGARGVGGCCRVGPAHIRAMARAIQEENVS
jgi:homocysteine S-methyltransferase